MEQNDVSLFDVDPETGEVVYLPSEDLMNDQEEISEGEGSDNVGDAAAPSDEVGDILYDPETVPENLEETEEDSSGVDFLESGNNGIAVVLDENVTAAILAAAPAGGSIGSSTLDYFDRVVSGLPADYKYIAYRTSSDNSYDAILYYGNEYQVLESSVVFDQGVSLEVVRVGTSGYSTETNYISADISDTQIDFSQSGNVIYYTNAVEGYPVLGGIEVKKGYDFYLVPVLIGVLALVLMSKLLFRR